jgi:type IV pilus assembly protein PilQ
MPPQDWFAAGTLKETGVKIMKNNRNTNDRLTILKGLFVWSLVLVLATAVTGADVNDQSAAVDVPAANVEATAEGSPDIVESTEPQAEAVGDKNIQSITFKKDMRIRDALAFLSLKYDKNIVPSPRVDGTLAFTSLFNVSFDEAMKAILGDNFRYEQDGNLIKVYTREEYKILKEDKERMITKVFTLYYISAAEAIRLVAPVLSGVGSIQGSSPASTVLPTGQSISAGSGGGDAMALNDMVVIRDYPEKIAEAEALIKQVDVCPKQVLVEATILSALLDEDTKFGIDWSTLSGVAITSIASIGTSGDGGAETRGFASLGTGAALPSLNVGVSKDNFTAIITALDSITDVTIMANPKILAINKQLGQVYIGNKLGYREGSTATPSGVVEGEVKFLETGTKLSFRPYIGDDGYIRMDIQPKDSTGTVDELSGVPTETSVELATNIIVKDGETVVIGGLFRDEVSTTRKQVPLLGDLPLIGFLFRGTSDLTQRQEVIVLLTPHIVKDPRETGGREVAEDVSRKREGARKELQIIDRRRLAEDCYAKAARYYMEGALDSAMKEINSALEFRPTYLEALRLKERILAEVCPAEAEMVDWKVLKKVGQQ